MKEIIGYYWDGTYHWTIYQKPNGSTMMRREHDTEEIVKNTNY
jgi:hypothetical protein